MNIPRSCVPKTIWPAIPETPGIDKSRWLLPIIFFKKKVDYALLSKIESAEVR